MSIKVFVFNNKEREFLEDLLRNSLAAIDGFPELNFHQADLLGQVQKRLCGGTEPSDGYRTIAMYPDQKKALDRLVDDYLDRVDPEHLVAMHVWQELRRR